MTRPIAPPSSGGGPGGPGSGATTLTVKGSPMNKAQQDAANTLIGVGLGLHAPAVALVACIFDAIYESSLGVELGTNSVGYGGVLGGATSVFGNVNSSMIAQATSFFKGGNGFQAGGAIAASRRYSSPAVLGSQVTAAIPFDSQGVSTQYERQSVPGGINGTVAEAQAIVKKAGGGSISVVAGSSDKTASATTPFYVGDSSNPNEDVWTAVNRLAQARQWYLFSDGETCYLADGTDLLAQSPVMTIDRWGDADKIQHLDFTWDNTAFQYTSNHTRRSRQQRKSSLAKVSSPVQAQLQVICEIDRIRGGDVIELSGCGPGDGKWLVGDARRSVFLIYTECTLVPGITPLTEAIAVGGTAQSASAQKNAPVGTPTGSLGHLSSPFTKRYTADLSNTDMGVDIGTGQGIAVGDPILAIGDCYLRSITSFFQGQPGMWFELVDKSAGYWGWYVAEQINPKLGTGPKLIKAGTVVATFASSGTAIEIGWAAAPGVTATLRFHPSEYASRHDGNGTTDGRAFLRFLQQVGVATPTVAGPVVAPQHGHVP